MENLINPAPKESSNRVEEEIIEDLVVVAVRKEIEASKLTLLWAIRNWGGKKICILHVHQLKNKLIFGGNVISCLNDLAVGGMSEKKSSETDEEVRRLWEEYHQFFAKEGVQPENHWLKTTNGPIEKGIVNFVTNPEHRIGKLVMGAASDSKYSVNMIEPESRKAIYVWKNAPTYCNIWFICKGNLIYTTGDSKASSPGHGAKRPEMMKLQLLPSGEPLSSETHVDLERNVDGLDRSKESEAITDSPSPSIKRRGDKGKGRPLEALLQAEDKSHDYISARDLELFCKLYKGSGIDPRKLYEEVKEAEAAAQKSKRQAYEESMQRGMASKRLQAEESSHRVENEIIEDRVFVAVGKQVEASKLTLLWAIRNSGGKKIFILHVHQLSGRKLILEGMSETNDPPEEDLKEMRKVFEEYDQFCAKEGVRPDPLFYYTNGSTERGIVKLVTHPENRIRKLVMGAASDSKYSEEMIEPTSNKAMYVWKNTPAYCNIWFICKGNLIYTTRGLYVDSERNVDGIDRSKDSEAITDSPSPSVKRKGDRGKGPTLEDLLRAEDESRDCSDPRDLGSGVNRRLYEELEKAKAVAEKSKRQAHEGSMKRRIAESESLKAVEKAKEQLEKRKEAEEELTTATEKLKDLKAHRDSILEDLARAKEELAKAKKEVEDRKNENIVLVGELSADLDEKSSLVIRVEKVE